MPGLTLPHTNHHWMFFVQHVVHFNHHHSARLITVRGFTPHLHIPRDLSSRDYMITPTHFVTVNLQ